MKRLAALAATAAIATSIALITSGCSSSSTPADNTGSTGNAENPVTVTFWGTYGDKSPQEIALDKNLIPAFEAANPRIKVKYTDLPYDDLLKKLTTSAAGGVLPDLVRSDIIWVPQLAQLGVLEPLSKTMKGFKELAATTYPGALSTNKYKSVYYGLPLDTNTRVLLTSQKALDAAGVTKPPATFDGLIAMANKLKGTGVKVYADSGLSGWNVFPWIWSGGGEVTNAKQTKATGYLNSPKSVAAVQMLVDLYKEGQIPNLITGNTGATSTGDGVTSGKYASIFAGPWENAILAKQFPTFKPIYAPIPAGTGGSISVVGGEDIVLTKSSKHKEAAEKFIRFALGKKFQLAMSKAGQMTVVPAYAAKAAAVQPYLKTFSDQLKSAKSRLVIPQEAKADTILNNALVPAFKGKTSVKAALTNAAKQIDPLLAGGGEQ